MNEYQRADSLELIFSGENFFEKLSELIDSAQDVIHLQTYIFAEDETGRTIAGKLINAAKRGVKVFMLADAFGSRELPKPFRLKLLEAGIHFRLFSPMFSSESIYAGRRLHHKVAVADSSMAIVGGINIADKYHGSEKEIAWLDYAVMIKGSVCSYLDKLCRRIYEKNNSGSEMQPYNSPGQEDHWVRFRRNDWIRGKNEIHKSYREAILSAERSIIIVGSYFLPGYFFRQMLKKARKRGVAVHIILAGKSDVPWLKNAEKYLYRFLLHHGARIYEWPNSVLHGKAMIVDNKWITMGSYNLNHLSHYRSIELNADIKDAGFVSQFKNHLEKIMGDECREVNNDNLPHSAAAVFRNSVAYYYYLALMKIFIPKRMAFVKTVNKK